MGFLSLLLDALLPRRNTAKQVSGVSLEVVGRFVAPSSFGTPAGDVVYLLPYREPLVRALIVEAKFHEMGGAFEVLGSLLAEYLQSIQEENAVFEERRCVLVPIPLSKERFRERGYNQAERIVQEAKKHLPHAFSIETHTLKRVRHTKPQTTLSRTARLRNLEDAFVLTGPLDASATYVLVDDVSTTGATLCSAAKAFAEAGAHTPELIALAH